MCSQLKCLSDENDACPAQSLQMFLWRSFHPNVLFDSAQLMRLNTSQTQFFIQTETHNEAIKQLYV